jgi:hypothetical protein
MSKYFLDPERIVAIQELCDEPDEEIKGVARSKQFQKLIAAFDIEIDSMAESLVEDDLNESRMFGLRYAIKHLSRIRETLILVSEEKYEPAEERFKRSYKGPDSKSKPEPRTSESGSEPSTTINSSGGSGRQFPIDR